MQGMQKYRADQFESKKGTSMAEKTNRQRFATEVEIANDIISL